MTLPTLPSTHTWVQGGPILNRANSMAIYAQDGSLVWVWDESTGLRVTNLLDANASPISAVPVVGGRIDGVGVPVAVTSPSFSVGQWGPRFYGIPVQAVNNAASAASSAASSASSAASSAALVGAPAGSAIDAYLGGSASALLDSSGNVQSGRSVFRGNNGKRYKIVACALRYVDSTSYWQPINDTNHHPVGVSSVTTNTSNIVLNYDFTTTGVGSLVVVPDESLCGWGFSAGASVGLSQANITLARGNVSDYVSYNGSTWSSLSGVFTGITFDASGNLTLNHDYVGGPVGQVSVRDGAIDAQLGTLGNTSTVVVFRDYAGTKLTTAATTMRAYVTRIGTGSINPQTPGSVASGASANLWVYGVFEV